MEAQPGGAGVRAFAAHYEARAFAGRRRELDRLDRWRDGAGTRILVVAPAGLGKSALVLRWASSRAAAGDRVAWVPVSARFGTAASGVIRDLLAARLRALGTQDGGDWEDAAARTDAIVVIDGLDEASDAGLEYDLRALASTPARIVVAARRLVDRDATAWRDHLGWADADVLELDRLSRADVSELFDDPATTSEAMRVTGGDPLELQLRFLGRERVPATTVDVGPVAAALACAVAPIRPTLLARCASVSPPEVEAVLQTHARAIVVDPDGGVSFAHPRLGYDVLDALEDERRAAVEHGFATVMRAELARLLAGGEADADTEYVLAGCRIHLTRAAAPLDELARLVERRWLEVWASAERGVSGFLADVRAIWAQADRQQAQTWSDAAATLQLRCAAVVRLLDESEGALGPSARAYAVRLRLRSQRAAIASLAAVTDAWRHAQAVRALLDVLDDRGFDLLLASAPSRSDPSWPTPEVMRRLLDVGLEDEALLWLEAKGAVAPAVACLPRLSERGRDLARAAIRGALQQLQPDPASMTTVVDGAMALPVTERDAWLATAVSWVADEDALFWDAYNGETDPRLDLALGFAAAGDTTSTPELLRRVVDRPYPFAEQPAPPGPEVTHAIARCAERLDDDALRAEAKALAGDRFAARLGLVEAGTLPRDALEASIGALELDDAALIRRAAPLVPSAALATRTLALVRRCVEDLTVYAHGYALYAGLLVALGELAPWLGEDERKEAIALVWHRVHARGAPTVDWWHVVHAIVPLLAASPDTAVAEAVMAHALAHQKLAPELCAAPRWSEVWSESQQRTYVRALLDARRVGRPRSWCELLCALARGAQGEPARLAAGAAVDLAVASANWGLAAEAAGLAGPRTWRRVAALLRDESEKGTSVAWPLSTLLSSAPTEDARVEVARLAWSRPNQTCRMGCAGALLAALPHDEAEAIATDLVERDALGFVGLSALPPKARTRAVERRRAALASDDWIGRARLLVELGNVPDVDLGRERTALLDHLHAALRDPTAPEVWAELTIVLRQLDAEELAGFEADISARAPNDLVHAYASRLAELGDHARRRRVLDHITTHDRRPQDVLSMQILLADASTLAELEPFLAEHPDYAGYAWVIDGIRRRGWAVAYARRALRETTRTRIAIWDALWKQLDDPLRAELRPALLQALADDVRGGIGTRHDFWDRLDLAERRDLWRLQWSADRPVPSRPHVSLPAAPSLALGLADEHARTVEEVVRWLVGG